MSHFEDLGEIVCLLENLEFAVYILANSVNTRCRPSKLIATPFCKIIIDALGQDAHCFVSFFIINIEQIIV